MLIRKRIRARELEELVPENYVYWRQGRIDKAMWVGGVVSVLCGNGTMTLDEDQVMVVSLHMEDRLWRKRQQEERGEI